MLSDFASSTFCVLECLPINVLALSMVIFIHRFLVETISTQYDLQFPLNTNPCYASFSLEDRNNE